MANAFDQFDIKGREPNIIGSNPFDQFDEAQNAPASPSLGSKLERDSIAAAKGMLGGTVFDKAATFGDFVGNIGGDLLGSAAGPEAVKEVDSAKQFVGNTMLGRELSKVAESLPESVTVPMRIVAPVLNAAGLKDILQPVVGGAKKLSAKLGTESGNTFPNGVMRETAPNMAKGRDFPDTEEINKMQETGHNTVSEAYQGIGATLRPEAEQSLKSDLLNQIGALQINPAASPKTIGAVKALYDRITIGKINPITGEVTQAPLTVPEVDGFRRLLGNTAGEDAAAAGKMRGTIDNFLNGLSENSFAEGGPEAVAKLNTARAAASRNFKLQQFSEMVKNADGNPNKIQKAAFNFLKEQDNLAGLDARDIAALKAVRDGTGVQKAMQMLGKTGFDSNNVVGPLVGGALTAGALPIVGTAARYGNKLAVRGTAKKALETLAERRVKANLPPQEMPPHISGLLPAPTYYGSPSGLATEAERLVLGDPYRLPNPTIEQMAIMPPEQANSVLSSHMKRKPR